MLTVNLSCDTGAFKQVAEHSSILPHISLGTGDLEVLMERVQDTENLCYLIQDQGFPVGYYILEQTAPGVYEGHSAFLPPYRGREALKVAKELVDKVFLGTDCVILTGKCPGYNKAVLSLHKMIGMKHRFTHPKYMKRIVDGQVELEDCHMLELNSIDWFYNTEMGTDEGKKVAECLNPTYSSPIINKLFTLLSLMGITNNQYAKAQAIFNVVAPVAGVGFVRFLTPTAYTIANKTVTYLGADGYDIGELKCQEPQ